MSDAADVAVGVTQPGAPLCSQALCEGELTLVANQQGER